MSATDIGSNVYPAIGLNNQAFSGSAAVNGAGVDVVDPRSAVLVVSTGAITGAPTTAAVTFKIQESDDNAAFTDVAGASVVADAADSLVQLDINLRYSQKYIRVVATPAFTGGTSPTITAAAVLILGGGPELPV